MIPTRVDPSSEAFHTNASYMRALVDELKQRIAIGGSFGAGNYANPYYATARLWDDGVIDPIDTRRVLGQAIGAAMNGPPPGSEQYGVFRM